MFSKFIFMIWQFYFDLKEICARLLPGSVNLGKNQTKQNNDESPANRFFSLDDAWDGRCNAAHCSSAWS